MAGLDMMMKALGFDPDEFKEKISNALAFLDAMQKDIAEIKASQLKLENKLEKDNENV